MIGQNLLIPNLIHCWWSTFSPLAKKKEKAVDKKLGYQMILDHVSTVLPIY